MKKPHEIFLEVGMPLNIGVNTAGLRGFTEDAIGRIQAEAFKAGVQEACEQLLKEIERLETDPDPIARELADPALKARIEDGVRKRLEEP